jgi:hypothetical protein
MRTWNLPFLFDHSFPGSETMNLYFDPRDHELITIVNDVLDRSESTRHLKTLLAPYLHPHGIKELAAPRALRMAYAIMHLLGSLETGRGEERLGALRSLMDEVLASARSGMQKNTARVLLQIMKELIRTRGDEPAQLKLARDFRTASTGKPRAIRAQLQKYHLLEMPEEWNQIAFDDHVHDASTKGRKTPTHLIMDAWIKGLRSLTVVYYNYVEPSVARELLEAADILNIRTRIAIQFRVPFRSRYIRFLWIPRGFAEPEDFIHFLNKDRIRELQKESRLVSELDTRYVLAVLNSFNERHRHELAREIGRDIPNLSPEDFLAFVGQGQPSILHLGQFIHSCILPILENAAAGLRRQWARQDLDPASRDRIRDRFRRLDELDAETVIQTFLSPEANPDLPHPDIPPKEGDLPRLLTLSPHRLLKHLRELHSYSMVSLSLGNVDRADVLELLYDCRGLITHLEIFNLKDAVMGNPPAMDLEQGTGIQAVDITSPDRNNRAINELQQAINSGNTITLKRVIREIIWDLEKHIQLCSSPAAGRRDPDTECTDPRIRSLQERKEKLVDILFSIPTLQGFYRYSRLRSLIGSASTGRSGTLYGMGLAVTDTLPASVRREVRRAGQDSPRQCLPVQAAVAERTTYRARATESRTMAGLLQGLRSIPGLARIGMQSSREWVPGEFRFVQQGCGNVATLGGLREERGNSFALSPPEPQKQDIPFQYLNSWIKNGLKVLTGFVPAFLTFALTKEWWFLAYFGALIWFGITGLRNIIQSVAGGGGIRRSPLLRWNSYVSWDRISDSLLFTGFSVPLLDYLVKTRILDDLLDITTSSSPLALYSFMAVANGLYISGHNIFRGLPGSAAVGNLFRSILSIPLALAFNAVIGLILGMAGVPGANLVLQKWAAVISKLASDCVAGVIEGMADRFTNIRMRTRDYQVKLDQLFDTYAALELLFPEENILEILESPKRFIEVINTEARGLEKIMIINALDLLYFWMYQPRARVVFRARIRAMTREERQILYRSQYILKRYREISQLFVDGIVGKHFSKALALYLDRSDEYLKTVKKLVERG